MRTEGNIDPSLNDLAPSLPAIGQDDRYAILAYELRAPLNALSLGIETIMARVEKMQDAPPPWLLNSMHRQRRSVRRLLRLSETLLESCLLDSGSLALRRESCDLRDLARDALSLESDDLLGTSVSWVFEGHRPVIGAWDARRLRGAIGNLISNAMKYGSDRPIKVTVGGDATLAWVQVSDHGIGIVPEDHDWIFERYTRSRLTPAIGGFGLGLWLAKTIVVAHGGNLSLRSVPGQGATFTVTLPRWIAAAIPTPGTGEPLIAAKSPKG